MPSITMLDLRQHTKSIIRRVQRGEELTLTYRGKAVLKLGPIREPAPPDEQAYAPLTALVGALACEPFAVDEPDRDIDRLLYER